MLAFVIVNMVLGIKLFKHIEKLFSNINTGDTPFTLENVDHIKKVSYFMIALIITPAFVSAFGSLLGMGDTIFEINGISILSILILFSFAYIFEYGYELQLDSKGKIYGMLMKKIKKPNNCFFL